jgi:hypothetical protein
MDFWAHLDIVDSVMLVPGSAVLEARVPALARSSCRFMYLFNYYFSESSYILSPSSASGSPFVSMLEFNHGFWFQATEAGADASDPSGRISLVGGGLYPLSGDLAPGSDIALEWNITFARQCCLTSAVLLEEQYDRLEQCRFYGECVAGVSGSQNHGQSPPIDTTYPRSAVYGP